MSAQLNFVGHRITDLEVHIDDQLFRAGEEALEESIEVQNNIDQEKKLIEVSIACNVTTKSRHLKIFLKIKGLFQGTPDVDEALLTKFASQNAPAILYPFARATIANITAQANIPVVYLATVNFAKANSVQSIQPGNSN